MGTVLWAAKDRIACSPSLSPWFHANRIRRQYFKQEFQLTGVANFSNGSARGHDSFALLCYPKDHAFDR